MSVLRLKNPTRWFAVLGAITMALVSIVAFAEPNLRSTIEYELSPDIHAKTSNGVAERFGWPTAFLYAEPESWYASPNSWSVGIIERPYDQLVLFGAKRSYLSMRVELLVVNVLVSLLFVIGGSVAFYQLIVSSKFRPNFGLASMLAITGIVATYLALGVDQRIATWTNVVDYVFPTIRFVAIVAFWFAVTSLMWLPRFSRRPESST